MEEILQILNKNGSKSSQIISREKIHRLGYYHLSIMAFLIDIDFNILIQKRSINKDSNPNKWDVSCAGHVRKDENPILSAQREIYEELGVKINDSQLYEIGFVDIKKKDFFYEENFIENERNILFIALCKRPLTLKLQKEEVQDVRWIHYHDLLNQYKKKEFCIFSEVIKLFKDYMEIKYKL